MVQHHLAQHLAGVPAGVGVVADEGDSRRCQQLTTHCHQLLTHVGRHPRIDPVRHNVIELAVFRPDLEDVRHLEGDVVELQSGHGSQSGGYWLIRQVDAGEVAGGQRVRHRNQVAGISASDLEHPAPGHRRRLHAEESADSRQTVGVRLQAGEGRVFDLVIRIVGHELLLTAVHAFEMEGRAMQS